MTSVKVQSILSYNSVILKTANAEVNTMLATFTSVTKAVYDTEHCNSKHNVDIWLETKS
jgi:2-iminoacetate synthase ThiH